VSQGGLRSRTCGFSFLPLRKRTLFQSIGRRAKCVMSTARLADRLTAPTELGPNIVAGDPQILHQVSSANTREAIAGNGAGARVLGCGKTCVQLGDL
jgi:hypothetical protein